MTEKLQQLLNHTPWGRMVHWFGRATDFPEQVEKLLTNTDEKEIFGELSKNIEHQDGVFQATPYMAQALIELLKEPNTNKEGLLKILLQVYDAVKFQVEEQEEPEDEEISLEDDLWPEFEDEDEDEMLWEEYEAVNFYYWQKHSYDAIVEAKELIKSFKNSESSTVKELAERFFE